VLEQKHAGLWVEKYRPKTLSECILPEQTRAIFNQYVKDGEIPHLLFSSSPGTGKTTCAKALCNDIGADHILINASLDRSIDVVRTKIAQYVSTVSMSGNTNKKIVILDEFDNFGVVGMNACKAFFEEFSDNARFILTANHANRIIAPLHSRCAVIDFNTSAKEAPKMQMGMFKRICDILKENNVEYEQKVVAELVKTFFPDFRRTLGELQRYSKTGAIDTGIMSSLSNVNIDTVIGYMKDKNFRDLRKWVEDNADSDPAMIFDQMYDALYTALKPQSVPQAVLIIAEYQYKSAMVASQEINTTACCVEIMSECEFK